MKNDTGAKKNNSRKTGTRKPNNRRSAKHNAKGFNLLAISVFILVVAMFGYIAVQAINKQQPKETEDFVEIPFWFTNATTNKWETEIHKIPKGKQTAMISQVLTEWRVGPKSELLAKSIPENISIDDVKFDDVTNTVSITFSEEYNNMGAGQSAICNCSLVYTLTEFSFITDVHFYVGESELLKSNGLPIGALNRSNIELVKPQADDSVAKTILLYFADEQAMGLLPEERVIKVSPNQALEKYIVEELIKGPKVSGHYPVISPDVKLRPIKTEEGLCYVDFTADFTKKFDGGSSAEDLLIYSIVNSLTEMPSIKKVQILAEGDKISDAQNFSTDLSKPFERDEYKIIK